MFADISIPQLLLIAAVAVITSIVGGLAGYGTGALMPLVLVPIVGPEPVVPIIALSALFTNTSRATAFRAAIDWRRAAIVLTFATPTCLLGAWGYTTLGGEGIMAVIGTMMCASVPLRRFALRRGFKLGERALAAASVGWGVVVGGTTGAGIILLSMLLAAGLQGGAVIATDAAISVAIGVAKIAVFGVAGVVGSQVIAVAVLIGLAAFPGAFLAKQLVDRLSLRAHVAILDGVVLAGGAAMILGALTR
jgi:uncharacterized membrane protein YfcA